MPATRDAAATQAKLLAAATREFTLNGFEKTRVDAIAERAGVNKRMLYVYFENKHGMYLAVLREHLVELRDRVALIPEDLSPIDGVEQLVRVVGTHMFESPDFSRLMAWVALEGSELATQAVDSLGLQEQLESFFVAGCDSGDFRRDLNPKLVVFAVFGMGLNLFGRADVLAARMGVALDEKQRESSIEAAVELMFRGIRAV